MSSPQMTTMFGFFSCALAVLSVIRKHVSARVTVINISLGFIVFGLLLSLGHSVHLFRRRPSFSCSNQRQIEDRARVTSPIRSAKQFLRNFPAVLRYLYQHLFM